MSCNTNTLGDRLQLENLKLGENTQHSSTVVDIIQL